MPPELMELYNLYKQELETRNKKENQFVEELNNEIIRVWIYCEWRSHEPYSTWHRPMGLWRSKFDPDVKSHLRMRPR